MSKYLGVKVDIDGKNTTDKYCVECGRLLNQREFLEGSGYCQPCRKKNWDAGRRQHQNSLGENKIDEILIQNTEKN